MHALFSVNFVSTRESDLARKIPLKVYSVVDERHAAPDFAMLLAETNYNQGLLGALKNRRKSAVGNNICAGIFLTDPFLNLTLFLQELSSIGVSCICNFPSVAFYGTEFCRQLDQVGLGLSQELKVLASVQKTGFDIIASLPFAADAHSIAQAQQLDPPRAWLIHNGIPTPNLNIAASVSAQTIGLAGEKYYYQRNPKMTPLPAEYSGIAQAVWWDCRQQA